MRRKQIRNGGGKAAGLILIQATLIAALPTFGGGIWSSTFIAYGLGFKKRTGFALITLGSILSYFTLYGIMDTLLRTYRYFFH